MPWQNNENGEGSDRSGDGGKRRDPWSSGQSGGQGGGGKEPVSGPRSPWGDAPGPRGGNDGKPRGNGTPDFDDFIRRSQEKLRGLGGGNGGGGGNRGGGNSMPNIPWALIGGGAALLLLATTSAYQVGAGERAVVTRFGQYVSTSLPGFHLKLPAPIEHVTKVRFEDIRTTLIGTTDGGAENLMITGDGNVISIAYAVRWRIKNA